MNTTMQFVRLTVPASLRRAWLIRRAITPTDDSPISPSSSLRGSSAATLQKKMLVNTAGVLFELLGKTNDRTLITSAGSYLGGAFYQLYRALHRASGGKEGYFGLDATAYQSGAVDAQMRTDYIAYASSLAQLSEKDGAFASMEDEALASLYPGLMQSVTQVLHSTEEKTNSLLGRK